MFGKGNKREESKSSLRARARAEAGDPAAAYSWALCLYNGDGVPKNLVQARHWFEAAATLGHVDGKFMAGFCYFYGHGGEKDEKKGVALIFQAADGGSRDGAFIRARTLEAGRCVAKDEVEARRWFEIAATRGSAKAMTEVGRYHQIQGTDKTQLAAAAAWFRKAADAGDKEGAFKWAFCLQYGDGVHEDRVAARQWFETAAERGHIEGAVMAGRCYAEGWGGAKELTKAAYWFQKAAEAGDANGAFRWADCLFHGNGVAQDFATARSWLENLAERGYASGMDWVGRFHENGWGGDPDLRTAKEWYRKASEAGSSDGAYNWARLAYRASANTKDLIEARSLFEIAAERGNEQAIIWLARSHEEGKHFERNLKKAAAWYFKAAKVGSKTGASRWADFLLLGENVAKDLIAARRWYEIAADRGDAESMSMIGRCLYEGWGGEIDLPKAAEWYRKAAEAGSRDGMFNRADVLLNGQGATKNPAAGRRWFEALAELGDADGMNMAGRCHYEGWGGPKDLAKASDWYRKEAQVRSTGDPNSSATFPYRRNGSRERRLDVRQLIEIAVERGDADGLQLAGLVDPKLIAGQDSIEAIELYAKSAENGNAAGMASYGQALANGWGTTVNTEAAAYWLRRSCEMGNAQAHYHLARLHEQGAAGVVKSQNEARRLYEIAAQGGVQEAKQRLVALVPSETATTELPVRQPIPYDRRFVKLDTMIGLQPVKSELHSIAQLIDQQQKRKFLGRRTSPVTAHMLFLGNPGTGKTTVARIVGEILASIGLLHSGHVIEVDRSKLVGRYVGATEAITAAAVESALDGILFVDEAYTLTPESSPGDYGHKAMEIILKAMEDHRDRIVMIFAGYDRQMEMFLASNPGMRSRIPNVVRFPDYNPEELLRIAESMIKGEYQLTEPARKKLSDLINEIYDERSSDFGNARDIRNLIDKIRRNSAVRPTHGVVDLIEASDIPTPKPKQAQRDPMMVLDGMIGLATVKERVKKWQAAIKVEKRRREQGVADTVVRSRNMVFTGNPGTGKTEVARLVAEILFQLKETSRNKVVEVTRSKLVAEYLGQTAPRVRRSFEEARGGVLFIDEAYALIQGERDSFGQEAVDELIACAENMRDEVVVIMAGYSDDMERFLDTNAGLRSRFRETLHFEDYNPAELLLIYEKFAFDRKFFLSFPARTKIQSVLQEMYENRKKGFANARSARNLFEGTVENMDMRLAGCSEDTDLFRIEESDIPKSRIGKS